MLALHKNKRKFFAAAAAALILILSIVPAFAEVETQPDGTVISIGLTAIVPNGCYLNGVYKPDGDSVGLGSVGVNSSVVLPKNITKQGYYISYWILSVEYMTGLYDSDTTFIQYVYSDTLTINATILSYAEDKTAPALTITPVFEEGYGPGGDDEYHSAAFIRVLNALWQNFYSTFLSLTGQLSVFGISLISILTILVLVVVVFTIIKIIRGH